MNLQRIHIPHLTQSHTFKVQEWSTVMDVLEMVARKGGGEGDIQLSKGGQVLHIAKTEKVRDIQKRLGTEWTWSCIQQHNNTNETKLEHTEKNTIHTINTAIKASIRNAKNKTQKWSQQKEPLPEEFSVYNASLLQILRRQRSGVSYDNGELANDIPFLIRNSFEYLIRTGHLDTEGIFRLSGAASEVTSLKELFRSGEDTSIPRDTDPHAVASLVKQFLRDLSEPLITDVLYPSFIAAAGTDAIDRNYLIAALIRFLPEEHTTLLKYIVDFMAELSLHTDSNKMGLHNLATVIGPNIMRNPQDEAMSLIQDVVSVNSIAYALIKSREEIFERHPPRTYTSCGVCLYNFRGQNPDEISARAGDMVLIEDSSSAEGWYLVHCNGEDGLLPANHIDITYYSPTDDHIPKGDHPQSPQVTAEVSSPPRGTFHAALQHLDQPEDSLEPRVRLHKAASKPNSTLASSNNKSHKTSELLSIEKSVQELKSELRLEQQLREELQEEVLALRFSIMQLEHRLEEGNAIDNERQLPSPPSVPAPTAPLSSQPEYTDSSVKVSRPLETDGVTIPSNKCASENRSLPPQLRKFQAPPTPPPNMSTVSSPLQTRSSTPKLSSTLPVTFANCEPDISFIRPKLRPPPPHTFASTSSTSSRELDVASFSKPYMNHRIPNHLVFSTKPSDTSHESSRPRHDSPIHDLSHTSEVPPPIPSIPCALPPPLIARKPKISAV